MTRVAMPGVPERSPSNEVDVTMRRIARGSVANLAGTSVTVLANFALTITVTRGLSQARAGVFFSITSLFMIAAVAGQLGTNTGLVYFISRCRALGTPQLISGYLRAAVRPVMLIATSAGVGLFVLAPEVAALTNSAHVGEATGYLRVLALFIPLAVLENVALAATRGLGTMRVTALLELTGRPVLQLMLVTAIMVIPGRGFLGLAWAFGYAPAAVVAWFWWRRLRPSRGLAAHSAEPRGEGFWRFTAPRAMTSVVQIAMQRLDIILVGALAGAVQAAVYTAATRFVVAGQMGANAISLAAQPKLSETLARGEHKAVQEIYQTSTAWLMLVTWPLYLMFTLFGAQLMQVFGKDYGVGSDVLALVSLAMLVSTGCGMVDMVLSMAGHTSWSLANAVLALAIQVGLDIWLIPAHGARGAAMGWAAAIVVRNAAALTQVAITLRLHPFGRMTLACAAINLVAFAAVPRAARFVLHSSGSALVVGVVVGAIVYAVAVWYLRGPLQLRALSALRAGSAGRRDGR